MVLWIVNFTSFASKIYCLFLSVRSIDRSKKFQQNSQNYLIPDKTAKSDVLGNKEKMRIKQITQMSDLSVKRSTS